MLFALGLILSWIGCGAVTYPVTRFLKARVRKQPWTLRDRRYCLTLAVIAGPLVMAAALWITLFEVIDLSDDETEVRW